MSDEMEIREAIEKQEAQKVEYVADGYYDGELVFDEARCPRCRESFEVEIDDWIKYCPNCGQKLIRAWREVVNDGLQ